MLIALGDHAPLPLAWFDLSLCCGVVTQLGVAAQFHLAMSGQLPFDLGTVAPFLGVRQTQFRFSIQT